MRRRLLTVWMVAGALLLAGKASPADRPPAADQKAAAGAGTRAPGSQYSVTVFPIVVTPGENFTVELQKRFGEVVGMLLERAGMKNVELAEEPFSPPKDGETAQVAAGFAKLVRENPIGSDYAIFAQLLGTPKTGPQEIRTIVVDNRGNVILADRADQKAFSQSKIKPDCPLTCCVFVVGRIQKLWGLEDPLRKDAPGGKLNAADREKSGLPSESEIADMKERLRTMKENVRASRLTVYPIRLPSQPDKQGTARLADVLTECGLRETLVSDVDPRLRIQGDPNEQKVLWDTARAFRTFVQKNPPATEYALFADYGVFSPSPDQSRVSHVHFIVCDRAGDWVIVDFQNSHHGDFQEIDPKSPEDCSRLLVKRLKGYVSSD